MSPNFLQRTKEIYAVQNFKEFYSRIFSGKFSPFVAAACVNTPITPNHLTILMIPTGILGGIVLALGTNLAFLIGGLLFVLLNIIDAADGELARYTKRTSEFGDYLDRVAHYATNTALIFGLGVGLYIQTGHFFLLPLAFFANSAIVADDAVRDLLVTCGLQKMGDEEGSRKALKSETRITLFGGLGQLVQQLASNVAIFHIVPALALWQILMGGMWVLEMYFVALAVLTVVRFLIRAKKIHSAYA